MRQARSPGSADACDGRSRWLHRTLAGTQTRVVLGSNMPLKSGAINQQAASLVGARRKALLTRSYVKPIMKFRARR